MREGGRDGRQTEDCKVGLISEAPAVSVAEKTREECSQHHSQKRDGDELGVLTHGGKAALERRTEDGAGYVDVKAIEEHSNADQPQDPAVERGNWKPIKTCARVRRGSQFISPGQARPCCSQSKHR